MIKKTIKFTNVFTEQEAEKDEYFNLTLREWGELSIDPDFMAGLEQLQNLPKTNLEKNANGMETRRMIIMSFGTIDRLLETAYGRRVEDSLVKTKEYTEIFRGSGELEALTSELFSDTDKLEEFIKHIMPKNLRSDFDKASKEVGQKPEEVEQKPESVEQKPTLNNITVSDSAVQHAIDPDYAAYLAQKNKLENK